MWGGCFLSRRALGSALGTHTQTRITLPPHPPTPTLPRPRPAAGSALVGAHSLSPPRLAPRAPVCVLCVQTAARQLPTLFTDKVGVDEEGVLGFADEAMGKVANKLNTQVGLDSL